MIRRIFVITCLIIVSILVWAGIYARKQGFTSSWRNAIESEIADQGYHVDIGKLTLGAFRGLVAENVRFFSDETQTQQIAVISDIYLDVGLEKILNKRISIDSLDIQNGQLSLPLPNEETLRIGGLSGRIALTENLVEVIRMEANLSGIKIDLKGSLFRSKDRKGITAGKSAIEAATEENQTDSLNKFVHALARFKFAEDTPPQLSIQFQGDADNLAQTQVTAVFQAENFTDELTNYTIQNLKAEMEYDGRNQQGKVSNLELVDDSGNLSGNASWRIADRKIDFKTDSSADIKSILGVFFPDKKWGEIVFFTPPSFDAEGSWDLVEWQKGKPDNKNTPWFPGQVLGNFAADRFVVTSGIVFNGCRGDFSVKNSDFYIRNFRADHKTGAAFMNCKYQPGNGRQSLQFMSEVKMDPRVFGPFLREKETQRFLSKWQFKENSGVYIRAGGQATHLNLEDLQARGVIALQDFRLNSVPFLSLKADVEIDGKERWYRDVSLSREDGAIKADLAYTDTESRLWEIKGGQSTVDLIEGFGAFSPALKEFFEPYQFSSPPALKVEGRIDGRTHEMLGETKRQTDLQVEFASLGLVQYDFLGKELPISAPSGILSLKENKAHLHSTKGGLCGGTIELDFSTEVFSPDDHSFTSNLTLSKVGLRPLAQLLGSENEATGHLNSTLKLSGEDLKLEKIDGQGKVQINNSDLFSVPQFTALEPLVTNEAKSLKSGLTKCEFSLSQGIAKTQSIDLLGNISGEATLDFPKNQIDAIIINASKDGGAFRASGEISQPIWSRIARPTNPKLSVDQKQNKKSLATQAQVD